MSTPSPTTEVRGGRGGVAWIGICLTILILASETKYVLKDSTTASDARLDTYIALELLAYLAVAAYVALSRKPPPGLAGADRLELLMLGYVGLMALTAPFSPSPIYSTVRVIEATIVLLLLRTAVVQPGILWFRMFVNCFLLATFGMVVLGAVAPSVRGPLQLERFNWLATHPVTVGQFLALALTACAVLAVSCQWVQVRSSSRVLYWLGTLVFGAALIANNTRASAAAAALGLLVGVGLILPRYLRGSALALLAWLALVTFLTNAATIAAWVERGQDVEELGTLNARLPYWAMQVSRLADENLSLGFGVGASRTIFVDEAGLGGSHNAALNVLVDTGVLGLILWVALIIGSAATVLRWRPDDRHRTDRALWVGALVVLLVNGLTAEGLGAVASVGWIWFMVMVTTAAQIAKGAGTSSPPRPVLGIGAGDVRGESSRA